MAQVIGFAGNSGSGKTTLIEQVIPRLVSAGYRVSTIKHDTHGFDMDKPGKDTFRHKAAGASTVIIGSPERVAMITDTPRNPSLAELLTLVPAHTDLVIVEGFKAGDHDKIEVFRPSLGKPRACPDDTNVIAVATDEPGDPALGGVPILDINDIDGVTEFVMNRCPKQPDADFFRLVVDGRLIPAKDFLRHMLFEAVRGMIKPLKGCSDPKEVTLTLKYDESRPKVGESTEAS